MATLQAITKQVYRISAGGVNVYLLWTPNDLVLIDTGYPDDGHAVLNGLSGLGKKPTDLTHILITHCHLDHAGNLATLQRLTDAPTYMHSLDAEMVQAGNAKRESTHAAPGLMSRWLYNSTIRDLPTTIEPARVDHLIQDGERLPIDSGIQVIHIPGHSAGQVAFLWENVLFAADIAVNVMTLQQMPSIEDLDIHRESERKLFAFRFDVACFGHGRPLNSNAASRFQRHFG